MIRQYGGVVIATALWVIFLTSIIYVINIGQIVPTAQSKMITGGQLCVDAKCLQSSDITLPFFVPMRLEAATTTLHMQFQFELEEPSSQIQALYLPKVADNVSISLNGAEIRTVHQGSRAWNHPIFTQISDNSLRVGLNQIDLILRGPPQEGLELFPFLVGPMAELEPIKNLRTTMGISATRFSLGLMAILFVVIGSLWLARRDDYSYLWLSLSCLSAVVFLGHYGYDISIFPYKYWTLAWALSIFAYVFFILKFISRFLRLPRQPVEQVCLIFILASAAT